MRRVKLEAWMALAALLVSPAAWCQENPYVYVKMSLLVPWTLYFVFLAAVLIPFVVLVVLAWRKGPQREPDK